MIRTTAAYLEEPLPVTEAAPVSLETSTHAHRNFSNK